MSEPYRKVYQSRDGKVEISTNIPGFKWPTPREKVAGLLSAGLIDQPEADRLLAIVAANEAADSLPTTTETGE